MISARVRNMLVGLTMIAAIAVLMYGIILLGKMPAFGGLRSYTLTLESDNANGISNGSKVDLNGVTIGEVETVTLVVDASGKMVAKIGIEVDGQYNIPANSTASLGKQTIGTPYVSIATHMPMGPALSHDGTATIAANAADSNIIPQSSLDKLNDAAGQVSAVAGDLHKLLRYTTPEMIAKAKPNDPDPPVENVSTLIVRLNTTVDSVEKLLGDPKMNDQIHMTIKNLSDASAELKDSFAKADETLASFTATSGQAKQTLADLQKQTETITQKVADTLDEMQKAIRLMSQGDGTTGKLINDPRLYNSLVDLSKQLQSTVGDLDFLLQKWKDEGVNLKLK